MAEATLTDLVWPTGLQRTARPIVGRSQARARAGVADVVKAIDLLGEATSLPASDIVVSFKQEPPTGQDADGRAAAWFVWGDALRCVACDLYAAHGDNLLAIGQLIRGCTAEYSRGSTAAVRHALESHTPPAPAPPAPPLQPPAPESPPPPLERPAPSAPEDWSTALGIDQDASPSAITTAFRRLALQKHPDKGGTRQDWDRLMSAYQEARRSLPAEPTVSTQWEFTEVAEEDAIWSSLFPDLKPDGASDDVVGDRPAK